MRLTDYASLNFNNNMSTAAAFFDIEKVYTKGYTSRVPQGLVLYQTLCSLYINDMPQTPGVYLGLFADDTCVYATTKRVKFSESCSEVSVLLRCGVSAGT
jgi:hypothetical protein